MMQPTMTEVFEPTTLSAGLRAQVAETLRVRSDALASDLATALAGEIGADPAPVRWPEVARLLLGLLISTIEDGELHPRSGAVYDLYRLCPGPLSARQLYHSINLVERTALDELALDARIGATSEPWALVAQFVRQAGLDILASFTEKLLDAPAHGIVRDPLTTLIARPVFELALEQEVRRAHRHEESFAVILFDIDSLSRINKEHGYGAGDRLLERLGILARRFFRTHDWIARYDEDAIVALLPETSLDDAAALATRFRRTVQERLVLVDHKTELSVAVTLTAAAVGADRVQAEIDPGYVLAEAEGAILRAKLRGRTETDRIALLPTSVTILGAAGIIGCPPIEVRRMVRDGRLQASRRGRHLHIERAQLERLRAGSTGL
jgi:diguanylate cyclase (GGDEF)-like protein